MCCGAIMIAGIKTRVMGGRPGDSTQWKDYAVERLIEMAGKSEELEVVTGVLTEECQNIRYD